MIQDAVALGTLISTVQNRLTGNDQTGGNNRFSQFVSTVKNKGLAKQYYHCNFQNPKIWAGANPEILEMIPFYVASVNIPGLELQTQTVKDTGINRKVVVDKSYGSVVTTFYSDQQMITKRFFDRWLIQATIGSNGGTFMYPEDYITPELTIWQMNSKKDETYAVTLTNAYPEMVSEVSMSNDSAAPLAFSVSWAYETWNSNIVGFPEAKIPLDPMNMVNQAYNQINKLRALKTDPTKVNAILGILR